jgi:hypothetical protein
MAADTAFNLFQRLTVSFMIQAQSETYVIIAAYG